jgi:two-component system phosphate regulon sensor histidine kinase PhoR
MTAGRFFWKVFLIHAAVMATVLGFCILVILIEFERFQTQELSERLSWQARTLVASMDVQAETGVAEDLQALVRAAGTQPNFDARVTLIGADGTVIADSVGDPASMDNHANRPEVATALREGTGESVRWSHSVGEEMHYVAVRIGSADARRGVLRVSTATAAIGKRAQPWRRLLATIAFTSAGAVIVLALSIGILWSRRIGQIATAARTLSGGDLSAQVPVSGNDEVAVLGKALNRMRDRLARQLETIDRQRRTLESLVAQLHEGVIVADADGRLVLINSEADRLLDVSRVCDCKACAGLPVEQCIRQLDLQQMLRGAERDVPGEKSASPAGEAAMTPNVARDEARLTVDTETGPVTLLARAFDFQLPPPALAASGESDSPRGRLLVLTDVTELNRLVQVKADFAANASHELRTPLAAIRAALDTLRAVDWTGDSDTVRRTLNVIERHAGRMEAMVVDLLDLSRLESPMAKFDPSAVRTRIIFDEINGIFADALAAKELQWEVEIGDTCRTIVVNRELLRIALRNLVDNAIRFTERGGLVRLIARTENDGAIIEVRDTGCGIAIAEQERVFERFYQVQRARSGIQRGTGLGLSIVRHAAAAMNGRVTLTSELGKGTTVSLQLPQQP